MKPCKLVMCPLGFSEGHYYGNGGLTSAVPLLLNPTFVLRPIFLKGHIHFLKFRLRP
jgi:hypothetical protein